MDDFNFKDVGLLITHYNRSKSLERLLTRFQELNCTFAEIVVSDDCSNAAHQERVRELQQRFGFKYITAEKNRGLGNNINKGQEQVEASYTLYIQEDFVPHESFPPILRKSLGIIGSTSFDIIRFYSYGKYPYLKRYDEHFDEMLFNFWSPGYVKYYYYSDHPHLRRTSFPKKFGKYAEGINGDQMEYRMMMSFLRNKGTGLFYRNFQELFDHYNDSEEPSLMDQHNFRKSWRRGNNPVVKVVRDIYRHVKFNYNYLFGY